MKKANGRRAERQQERVESADDSDQYYSDDDGNDEENRPGAVRVRGINHVSDNVDDDNESVSKSIGSNKDSSSINM